MDTIVEIIVHPSAAHCRLQALASRAVLSVFVPLCLYRWCEYTIALVYTLRCSSIAASLRIGSGHAGPERMNTRWDSQRKLSGFEYLRGQNGNQDITQSQSSVTNLVSRKVVTL